MLNLEEDVAEMFASFEGEFEFDPETGRLPSGYHRHGTFSWIRATTFDAAPVSTEIKPPRPAPAPPRVGIAKARGLKAAQGLCWECSSPRVEGRSRCETHLAKRRVVKASQ